MNPKAFLCITGMSIDENVPHANVSALVFDTSGDVIDNPWGGTAPGPYGTSVLIAYMGNRDSVRTAAQADVQAAYGLEGDVDFVWIG